MHGGISPELTSIQNINLFDRRMEPPEDGLMSDLIWADPVEDEYASEVGFIHNEQRGASF